MSPSRQPTSILTAVRCRLRAEEGFTLIEMLVSAVVVILISAAVAQALAAGAHLSGYQQHRSQADQVAQQDQERMRSLSAKQLSALASPQTSSRTLSGTTYTISSQTSPLSSTGAASCATAGTGAVAYYRAVSTVTWTDTSAGHTITEASIITPPVGGTLLTSVVNQTGAALSGVSVTAAGQSAGGDTESGVTDAAGCVIFAALAPDTYALTFTDAGYVDPTGSAPVTDAATVTASGTARPTNSPEILGQAGSFTASFTAPVYTSDSSTTVNPATPQPMNDVSYIGAGSTLSMSAAKTVNSASPSGSTTLSANNLFPFWFSGSPGSYASNYHVWAGGCRQEEPPTAYDAFTLNPGSNITPTVAEPALNVQPTNSGARFLPQDVKITFTSTSGTPCSETWSEPVRSSGVTSTIGLLQNPGVPFATTGSPASASGQTGTLTVCVDAPVSGTMYKSSQSGVTATSFTAPTLVKWEATTNAVQGSC